MGKKRLLAPSEGGGVSVYKVWVCEIVDHNARAILGFRGCIFGETRVVPSEPRLSPESGACGRFLLPRSRVFRGIPRFCDTDDVEGMLARFQRNPCISDSF
ncbi:hypothetical protein HNY73_005839 [Argiope bruennichi]|uniref:Uncharacterized protein n=1 Tax=Argiope bruennichi TaxID=94029 RepID=A0A8T0FIS2_ARGBR|nr:hypothetical protein HNY73_005839 [Argiope bruennichi]